MEEVQIKYVYLSVPDYASLNTLHTSSTVTATASTMVRQYHPDCYDLYCPSIEGASREDVYSMDNYVDQKQAKELLERGYVVFYANTARPDIGGSLQRILKI